MRGLEFILQLDDMPFKELADKLGITKQNISMWASGKREIPKKYLPALSKMFNFPEEYFQKELTDLDKLNIQKYKLESEVHKVRLSNGNLAPILEDENMEKFFELEMIDCQIAFKDVVEKLYNALKNEELDYVQRKSYIIILKLIISLFEKCTFEETEVVVETLSVINDYFQYGDIKNHDFGICNFNLTENEEYKLAEEKYTQELLNSLMKYKKVYEKFEDEDDDED